MTIITGGKVTYGRTVKTGDYENKRADVELSFNVEDGANEAEVISHVASMAETQCLKMVGIKPVGKAAVDLTPVATGSKETYAAKANAETATVAPLKPPKAPTKPPKVEKKESAAISDSPEDRKPPADELGDDLPEGGDNLDDLLGETEPVKEITDVDLTSAITRVNKKLNNAQAIRALVMKHVPQGAVAQSRSIGQDRRQDFLDELEALIKPKV